MESEAIEGRAAPRSLSLRWAGVLLVLLVVSESVLGLLAAPSPGVDTGSFLAAHLVVGVGLVASAGGILLFAVRRSARKAVIAAGLAFTAVGATAVVGAAFLLSHNNSGAAIDRGLALVALSGAMALVIWGSE